MRNAPVREILTVSRIEGVWRVDHGGDQFGHSPEKDVARAAANRHARQMLDQGRSCEIRVSGEHGFKGA